MKKINKITNIALIFILGINMAYSKTVYANEKVCLRVPIMRDIDRDTEALAIVQKHDMKKKSAKPEQKSKEKSVKSSWRIKEIKGNDAQAIEVILKQDSWYDVYDHKKIAVWIKSGINGIVVLTDPKTSEILGHLFYGKEKTSRDISIERIFVRPGYRKRNIASLLLKYCMKHFDGIWLVNSPESEDARKGMQGFYERAGFKNEKGTGIYTWKAVKESSGEKERPFSVTLPITYPSQPCQTLASNQNETQREIIMQEYELDLNHLSDVKEMGLEALSREAGEVLYNPGKAEWMKNFTPMVFYELYAFLKNPESRGLDFIKEKPELFNFNSKNKHEELGAFLRNIVEVAVMKFSEKDKIAEIEATYRIKNETQKWFRERTGPKEFTDFGQGDEHALTGKFGYSELSNYTEKFSKAYLDEWKSVGLGRYYILKGKIDEAVTSFKIALLTKAVDRNIAYFSGEDAEKMRENILEWQKTGALSHILVMTLEEINDLYAKTSLDKFNPETVSLIGKELSWMRENSIGGSREIIEALGMDEEFSMKRIFSSMGAATSL